MIQQQPYYLSDNTPVIRAIIPSSALMRYENDSAIYRIEETRFFSARVDDSQLRRTGNPSHLFTKEEIKEVMQAADDRLNNMLVIDEFGYAHIISDLENGNSYPVRLESWDAGNNYVGKYSQLHTLDDSYTMALEGWLEYLKHCRSVRKDWCEENLSICELIEQIQEFYAN